MIADEFFATVESVVRQIRGSAAQGAAEAEGAATQFQAALATCMDDAGHVYTPPGQPVVSVLPPVYQPAWWRLPDVELAGKAGLGYAAYSGLTQDVMTYIAEPDTRSYESMSPSERAAYDTALDACFPTAVEAEQIVVNNRLLLESSFTDAMLGVTQSARFDVIRRQMAACVAQRGESFTGPDDIYDHAEELVYRMLDGVTKDDPDVAARVSAALAAEARVAAIEASCRVEQADEIAIVLAPTLDDWLASNSEQLENNTDQG